MRCAMCVTIAVTKKRHRTREIKKRLICTESTLKHQPNFDSRGGRPCDRGGRVPLLYARGAIQRYHLAETKTAIRSHLLSQVRARRAGHPAELSRAQNAAAPHARASARPAARAACDVVFASSSPS